MTLYGLVFYALSAILIASAIMVISARNPVHSVLYLILGFVNAAGLFLLAGAEFLALILVVVYVGAVAVLFLFVVMMLDVDVRQASKGSLQYLPIGALVGIILLVELIMVAAGWLLEGRTRGLALTQESIPQSLTNTEALGQVIYTDYIFLFQAAGVILLVAMVGAIVLTLRERKGVRRQSISKQISRTSKESIELVDMSTGRGG